MDAILFRATFLALSRNHEQSRDSSGGDQSSSSPATTPEPGPEWRLAPSAQTPETKEPHVPARAPARPAASPRLASPPFPPGRPRLPLPFPHALAHAPCLPHAHVLNPRRPSCCLQLSPGLPVSLRIQAHFAGQ